MEQVIPYIGGVFTLGVMALLIALRLRRVKPRRVGHWPNPPLVLRHTSAPVDMADVVQGADWWHNMGYEFGRIDNYDGLPVAIPGAIVIRLRLQPFSEGHLGLTRITHHDGIITSAVIELSSDMGHVDPALVVAHEIGHGLGFMHPDAAPTGHMLNKSYDRIGWNGEGHDA